MGSNDEVQMKHAYLEDAYSLFFNDTQVVGCRYLIIIIIIIDFLSHDLQERN